MENHTYHYHSKVAFSETDASSRVHFSQILIYVEKAEHAFLGKKGIPIFSSRIGWPRVKLSCDYLSSLKFEEPFTVVLELQAIGTSSLTWKFEIFKNHNEKVALGEMRTVKVSGEGSAVAITESEKNLLLAPYE